MCIRDRYGTISVALAPGGAVTSVSQALAALRLSGRSNVGLALDSTEVEAALADPTFNPKQLAVVHLAAGLSTPGWKILLAALVNAGFTGSISAEPPAPTDVSTWAAQTVTWLQQASGA